MPQSAPLSKTPRYFRLVCREPEITRVEELLRAEGFDFSAEEFSPLCRRLSSEPFPLGSSLAAIFGLIYIQDRSSMLPPLALNPAPGACVLDMCASPGGKTSFLAQLSGPNGSVLANEPGGERLATLRQNLFRMNLANVATCGLFGENLPLPEASFDHILLDPPCSGWGTAEKHPKTLTLWSEDKLAPLLNLQRALLGEAARLLLPGGRLVYSTCTTNPGENEEQTLWALENLPLELTPLSPLAGMSFCEPARPGLSGVLRVDALKSESQGFYLACLSKPLSAADSDFEQLEPAKLKFADISGLCRAAGLSADNLGQGRAVLAADKLWWLGQGVLNLCSRAFLPRGFLLGTLSAGEFRPNPRCRLLLPENRPGLSLDEPAEIRKLLSGQSATSELSAKQPGLYYKDLPLGLLTRKSKRLLWSGR